jgi:hypothetical protein
MFETPILLLIFNLPQTTIEVFNLVKKIKPKFLFVAADGPRRHKEGEADICAETRNLILDNIDWDCEVKTLFRENNLGCGIAVSEAITWFFENVEHGIILEDDVLPSLSFFPFCEELLIKYKDSKEISCVSGSNLTGSDYNITDSYVFSEYTGIWGWATWKRAWDNYDFKITAWDNEETKRSFKKRYSKQQYLFFCKIFDQVKNIDTWDYQWWFHQLINQTMGITPNRNLTKNIGFNDAGTHTFDVDERIRENPLQDVSFPMKHPQLINLNKEYDMILAKKFYWSNVAKKSIFRRLLNRIK